MDRFFILLGAITVTTIVFALILFIIMGIYHRFQYHRELERSVDWFRQQYVYLKGQNESLWRHVERMQNSANQQATVFNSRLEKLEAQSKPKKR